LFSESFSLTRATLDLKADPSWTRATAHEILQGVFATDDGDGDNRAELVNEMRLRIFGLEHTYNCISGSEVLKLLVLRRVDISRMGFWASLIIFLVLLVGYGRNAYDFWSEPAVYFTTLVVGLLQVVATSITFFLFCYVEVPIILSRWHLEREALRPSVDAQRISLQAYNIRLGDSDKVAADAEAAALMAGGNVAVTGMRNQSDAQSRVLHDVSYPEPQSSNVFRVVGPSSLGVVFIAEFWYLGVLAAAALFGTLGSAAPIVGATVLFFSPFWYCLQLMDVFRFPSMRALAEAMYVGGPGLTGTVIVACLICILFAVISFLFFSDGLIDGELESDACGTFYRCVTAHLIGAFDGGDDHGADLSHAIIPVAARGYNPVPDHLWDIPAVQVRSTYIKFFAFCWGFLLTALFGAQVVDAYSEIRAQEAAFRDSLEARCPLCGLSREDIDSDHPLGYHTHIHDEHGLKNYLFYLHYLKSKHPSTHTGIESHVWKSIAKGDVSWLPRDQCFALQNLMRVRAAAAAEIASAAAQAQEDALNVEAELVDLRTDLRALDGLIKARR